MGLPFVATKVEQKRLKNCRGAPREEFVFAKADPCCRMGHTDTLWQYTHGLVRLVRDHSKLMSVEIFDFSEFSNIAPPPDIFGSQKMSARQLRSARSNIFTSKNTSNIGLMHFLGVFQFANAHYRVVFSWVVIFRPFSAKCCSLCGPTSDEREY